LGRGKGKRKNRRNKGAGGGKTYFETREEFAEFSPSRLRTSEDKVAYLEIGGES